MKNRRKHSIKIIATAASVGIILVASTTAYAMNMFGLKDMVIGNFNTESANDTTSQNIESKAPFPTGSIISLQGYADSNECKAAAEWKKFTDSYDKDGALLDKVGNGPTGLDSKYDLYGVYTQEMADKLDEIVKKYNLSLHSSLNTDINKEELIQKAASGNFLGTKNTCQAAYMYEDGTFHIEGYAKLDSGLKIDYQFSNYKEGTFSDVVLNIGNKNDYDERSYKTTCGIDVRLAIGPKKSLIIADLGDSFITVNVLAGTATGFLNEKDKITSSDLEELANSFDFSLIK